MAIKMSHIGLLGLCLLVSLCPSHQRSLQQASQTFRISTKLYSGVGTGGLSLASNYTLTYLSAGSVQTGTVNATGGYPLTLIPGDLYLSDTFTRVGCIAVGLNPSASGVGGFVSTYADIIGTTTSSGIFSIDDAVILAGTNVSEPNTSLQNGSADPNEDYVFVVYDLGDDLASTKAQLTAQPAVDCAQAPAPATGLTPFLASAPTTSTVSNSSGTNNTAAAMSPAQNTTTVGILPVQNTSSSAATPSSGRRLKQFFSGYNVAPAQGPSLTQQASTEGRNAPAPGPSATQTDSVQINLQEALSDSQLVSLGGFTNVSCIAYTVLGQSDNSYGVLPSRIDVSVFLLSEADTKSWAGQRFSLTPNNIDFQAITLQNNNNNANQFTYLDGLNASAKYFLWTVTGMQNVTQISSDVILDVAYTAQASGSCANNMVSTYIGSAYEFGDSNTVASPTTAPAPARVTPATSSGSAPSGATAAAPSGGLQLQGTGTTGGSSSLFSMPGKKLL